MNDMKERKRAVGRIVAKGEDSPSSKLTEQEVRDIYKDPRSQQKIALAYGMSRGAIQAIKQKINWRHLWK